MAGYKGNAFITAILKAIVNGTPIPNLLDNAASSPLTNLYVTMHTADPTPAGDQTSFEQAWTGHGRVAIARTSSGLLVTAQHFDPVATITFPSPSSSGEIEVFWSIGVAASGASMFLWAGPISPNITIISGTPPQLTTASMVTEF